MRFESVNYPGFFITREGDSLKIIECTDRKNVQDTHLFRLTKSQNRKCLKQKHVNGLLEEKSLWSSCKTFEARLQGDGNFVINKHENGNPSVKWASNSCDKGSDPYVMKMQGDGNLVMYDGNGEA